MGQDNSWGLYEFYIKINRWATGERQTGTGKNVEHFSFSSMVDQKYFNLVHIK